LYLGNPTFHYFPTLPTGRQLNLDFQMVAATRIFIVVDRSQTILSDVARIWVRKRVSEWAKKIVSQQFPSSVLFLKSYALYRRWNRIDETTVNEHGLGAMGTTGT
jgi:hypothetical protein